MVFSSIPFLFYFLPLFIPFHYFARTVPARNAVLLAFSLLFYAWGEPWFVLVMLGSIVGNWQAALLIEETPRERRKWVTGFAIAANLLVLGIFKYADFALINLNRVLAHMGKSVPVPEIELPLGISFFTFHSMSYIIDVHRGSFRAARKLTNIALYISMFPQLVAGPIVRYKTVARQIERRRTTWGRVGAGARIFVIGLAQKVLIADEVARIADAAFDKIAHPTLIDAWLGLSAYTVQIYFDFAGYSNMAIGFAVAFGFTFPRNFRLPYTSRSITEFWRRWHMSLSTWFRDYLYIPLGGNRGSAFQTYRNLGTVFILCGLWHGASWTFVIWGAYHGALLIVERAGLGAWLKTWPDKLAWTYALLAAMFGWVWFRAADLSHARRMFGGLFGMNGVGPADVRMDLSLHPITIGALLLGAALALLPRSNGVPPRNDTISRALRHSAAADIAFVTLIAALSVLAISSGTFSPFLYFRF
ncbi:MAG: MBOAT family protein [Parvibaculum sp.]|uniref:MBOAT family O-acyltransferase n=1 Tax=Parvibaculum sp. TaxID=2024848 RepID=UPI0028427976|nr:MBOAT family protein [Parvibaculum sp.]MDR3498937.1 MBOAT family protein [Parvibaculum sp.]